MVLHRYQNVRHSHTRQLFLKILPSLIGNENAPNNFSTTFSKNIIKYKHKNQFWELAPNRTIAI